MEYGQRILNVVLDIVRFNVLDFSTSQKPGKGDPGYPPWHVWKQRGNRAFYLMLISRCPSFLPQVTSYHIRSRASINKV
ncbi:hypothetical protein Pfo_026322 [Paulownia fortunei]|nr:hypothetical protein Pfo_026322 [Paulownia fortunei]